MDTLKEQIMLRKMALNPDMKGEGAQGQGNLAQKSNLLSKFDQVDSEDEEESNASDSDSD